MTSGGLRYEFGIPLAAGGVAFLAAGLYGLFCKTTVTDDSGRRLANGSPGSTLGRVSLSEASNDPARVAAPRERRILLCTETRS